MCGGGCGFGCVDIGIVLGFFFIFWVGEIYV